MRKISAPNGRENGTVCAIERAKAKVFCAPALRKLIGSHRCARARSLTSGSRSLSRLASAIANDRAANNGTGGESVHLKRPLLFSSRANVTIASFAYTIWALKKEQRDRRLACNQQVGSARFRRHCRSYTHVREEETDRRGGISPPPPPCGAHLVKTKAKAKVSGVLK